MNLPCNKEIQEAYEEALDKADDPDEDRQYWRGVVEALGWVVGEYREPPR